MIKPAKDAASCGLQQLPEINLNNSESANSTPGSATISGMLHHHHNNHHNSDSKFVSLFEQRRLKGWWPCIVETSADKREIAVLEQDLLQIGS
jgi:hypothetical protein